MALAISGEMKIAIMIRMLSGASYLDILFGYCVVSCTVFYVFHEGIGWVQETFSFRLAQWLKDENWEALERVSDGFAGASGDIFKGVFGALDGLALKIRCPTISEILADPGNYYCRKGFYALNAQVICDKFRHILWVSTGHKGSTHDSTAFLGTELYQLLQKLTPKLIARQLFLVGDTAYPLMPFMMVPFPNAEAGSEEDAFNFWLSNSRIQIECTFGMYTFQWPHDWTRLFLTPLSLHLTSQAKMSCDGVSFEERCLLMYTRSVALSMLLFCSTTFWLTNANG